MMLLDIVLIVGNHYIDKKKGGSMWLYISGKDEKIDKWILNRNYNVEYKLGNEKNTNT